MRGRKEERVKGREIRKGGRERRTHTYFALM